MDRNKQEPGQGEKEPSIVARPPGPVVFGICPHCGRWFALQYVSARWSDGGDLLSLYRCKRCGKEAEFAELSFLSWISGPLR